jgi:hypothetical protein
MGCGRSKFHSQNEPETNGKSKTIDSGIYRYLTFKFMDFHLR